MESLIINGHRKIEGMMHFLLLLNLFSNAIKLVKASKNINLLHIKKDGFYLLHYIDFFLALPRIIIQKIYVQNFV